MRSSWRVSGESTAAAYGSSGHLTRAKANSRKGRRPQSNRTSTNSRWFLKAPTVKGPVKLYVTRSFGGKPPITTCILGGPGIEIP